MTALFAALRTLVVVVLFFWFWVAVANWARQLDPMFGGLLPAWTWPIGVAAAATGGALALTCAGLFAIRGKGTPVPFDPPRNFVAFGPYRAVRNPMYIGGWLLIVGFALIARSSSVLILSIPWLALVHLFVVLYEEPSLTARFGPTYDD